MLEAELVDLGVEISVNAGLEVEVEEFEHVDALAQGDDFGQDLVLGR